MQVDFPLPDGPTSATISPADTSSSNPFGKVDEPYTCQADIQVHEATRQGIRQMLTRLPPVPWPRGFLRAGGVSDSHPLLPRGTGEARTKRSAPPSEVTSSRGAHREHYPLWHTILLTPPSLVNPTIHEPPRRRRGVDA